MGMGKFVPKTKEIVARSLRQLTYSTLVYTHGKKSLVTSTINVLTITVALNLSVATGSWEASPISIPFQKAYKSAFVVKFAFLVRFVVSVTLPSHLPLEEFLGFVVVVEMPGMHTQMK